MEFRKRSPVLHGKMFKTPKSCGSDVKGNCFYVQICNVKDKIIVEENEKKKVFKAPPKLSKNTEEHMSSKETFAETAGIKFFQK